ncbi:hypothetical protein EGW08_002302 [Elysia chlorotica]|uniref:C-type lectin domain-containing protein n=1 Tax=Elysia chlorotica TaxID=188477 RepID=A0A3S1BVS8_ELYCH|nr:hypothetical protein EGW08_002302 [Elysia chlorotica]
MCFSPDPKTRHSVWSMVIGGWAFWMHLYGVNQAQVQRCLSCPTVKKAQLAIWLNLPGLIFIVSAACMIGVVMYAFYVDCHPIRYGIIAKTDQAASVVAGASSNTRGIVLRQTNYLECQTRQIGESWIAPSIFTCAFRCTNTENCQAVVFNEASGLCRLGSVAFGPLAMVTDAIPETSSLDKIYYMKQPAPPCDTANNFAIYDKCGASACLYLSTSNSKGYDDAKTDCSQMNSRLFVGNTIAKYSLFWYVSKYIIKEDTYIGLNDIEEEGTFVWENGEPLSAEQNLYIWNQNQPSNGGSGEDCAEANHGDWGDFAKALNDEKCYVSQSYICERCEQC